MNAYPPPIPLDATHQLERVKHYAKQLARCTTSTFLIRTTVHERARICADLQKELQKTRTKLEDVSTIREKVAPVRGIAPCPKCTCETCVRAKRQLHDVTNIERLLHHESKLLARTVSVLKDANSPVKEKSAHRADDLREDDLRESGRREVRHHEGSHRGDAHRAAHRSCIHDMTDLYPEQRQLAEFDTVLEEVESLRFRMCTSRTSKCRLLAHFQKIAVDVKLRCRDVMRGVQMRLNEVHATCCEVTGLVLSVCECETCRATGVQRQQLEEFRRLVNLQAETVERILEALEDSVHGRRWGKQGWLREKVLAVRAFVSKD